MHFIEAGTDRETEEYKAAVAALIPRIPIPPDDVSHIGRHGIWYRTTHKV
jgi:hypothetical protein